jgi:hypothetical protein
VIKKRGPHSICCIIEISKDIEHFLELLRKYFTKRIILRISERTKLQSETTFWYLYRKCVITGTLCKRVISQNLKNEKNEKINRIISKQFQSTFTNQALEYGKINENTAINIFFKSFSQNHKNAKLRKCGLVIYENLPFVAGSPDAIVACECCPEPYVVEVKCPFRLKYTGISNWRCLEYFNEEQLLKRSHTYFNQINLYQGILGLKKAFFIVYARDQIISKLIEFDETFFKNQIKNLSEYYIKFYLPDVIGKKI